MIVSFWTRTNTITPERKSLPAPSATRLSFSQVTWPDTSSPIQKRTSLSAQSVTRLCLDQVIWRDTNSFIPVRSHLFAPSATGLSLVQLTSEGTIFPTQERTCELLFPLNKSTGTLQDYNGIKLQKKQFFWPYSILLIKVLNYKYFTLFLEVWCFFRTVL